MTRYTQPQPRTDVEWDKVPAPVRAVIGETTPLLPGGKVTRGKIRESYSIYEVTLYVTPEGQEKPTHGVRLVVNYDGKNPKMTARVKVGEKWL